MALSPIPVVIFTAVAICLGMTWWLADELAVLPDERELLKHNILRQLYLLRKAAEPFHDPALTAAIDRLWDTVEGLE